jgi:hypothetical protein
VVHFGNSGAYPEAFAGKELDGFCLLMFIQDIFC